jgi:hypothetical protein
MQIFYFTFGSAIVHLKKLFFPSAIYTWFELLVVFMSKMPPFVFHICSPVEMSALEFYIEFPDF